jgi:hypothetical protein
VVALQALAEYAILIPILSSEKQLSISLTADSFSYQYQTITNDNSLVLQSVEVNRRNIS